MTTTIHKRLVHHGLAVRTGLLACAVCLLMNSAAQAQSTNLPADSLAPVIELEELSQSVADATQVFTVQIAEETELKDATLYYRRSGQQPYATAPLTPLGTSGFYTASIKTDPTDLRSIEYYVQARDAAGNRTISGFAFDPYQRTLAPAAVAQIQPEAADASNASENSGISTREPFYKRRWVQVAAGVVTVGIIAAALRSEDGEDRQFVPVEFILTSE